jgi:hypothetical protein
MVRTASAFCRASAISVDHLCRIRKLQAPEDEQHPQGLRIGNFDPMSPHSPLLSVGAISATSGSVFEIKNINMKNSNRRKEPGSLFRRGNALGPGWEKSED